MQWVQVNLQGEKNWGFHLWGVKLYVHSPEGKSAPPDYIFVWVGRVRCSIIEGLRVFCLQTTEKVVSI